VNFIKTKKYKTNMHMVVFGEGGGGMGSITNKSLQVKKEGGEDDLNDFYCNILLMTIQKFNYQRLSVILYPKGAMRNPPLFTLTQKVWEITKKPLQKQFIFCVEKGVWGRKRM